MSAEAFDCVSCGACCFSKNPRYLSLLGWDAARRLPPESLFEDGGRTFVRFDCGHCVHLDLSEGKAVCGVYDDRPEACRAFRAGSFECVKARRANGIMGAKVQAGHELLQADQRKPDHAQAANARRDRNFARKPCVASGETVIPAAG